MLGRGLTDCDSRDSAVGCCIYALPVGVPIFLTYIAGDTGRTSTCRQKKEDDGGRQRRREKGREGKKEKGEREGGKEGGCE